MKDVVYFIAFDFNRQYYKPTYFSYENGQIYFKNKAFRFTDFHTANFVYNKIKNVQRSPYLKDRDKTFGKCLLGDMTDRKISLVRCLDDTDSEIEHDYI